LILIYSDGKATTLGEVVDNLLADWRQKTATLPKLASVAGALLRVPATSTSSAGVYLKKDELTN